MSMTDMSEVLRGVEEADLQTLREVMTLRPDIARRLRLAIDRASLSTPRERLAALLHDAAIYTGWASCVHSPENEWQPFCFDAADRLLAAGVCLTEGGNR